MRGVFRADRAQIDETIRRSRIMAPVQRAGLIAMVLPLVVCVRWIGWAPIIALSAGMLTFLVMKQEAVRRMLGGWSVVLVWVLGEAAVFAAVVLGRGPTEYLTPMLGIPTILASVIWPPRFVRLGGVLTGILVLVAGAVTEGWRVIDDYPAFLLPAVMVTACTLLTLVAREAEDESQFQLQTDALTGTPNRFALTAALRHLESRDAGAPYAVSVVDIDHFKEVNDTAGHAEGDRVLQHVARVLRDAVGDDGTVYRYGGEEFVILTVGAAAHEAARVAERVRATVAATPVAGRRLTVSVGVAPHDDEVDDFRRRFEAADTALYHAKAAGRDRVEVAGTSGALPDPIDRRTGSGPGTATITRPRRTRQLPARTAAPVATNALDTGMLAGVERAHLATMMQRLYNANPLIYAAITLATIAAVPVIGWALLPAGVLAGIVYRSAQRRVVTMRNPIQTMALVWMVAQLGTIAGMPWLRGDVLWVVIALSGMIVAPSAAFPRRYVVAGVIWSALLAVGFSLIVEPRVFDIAPQVIFVNLAYLLACAITGRAAGTLAVRIRADSTRDELTGLPNRAAFETAAEAMVTEADELRIPLSLILTDIDHFKRINDTAGHAEGDRTLVAFAMRLREGLRADAMVFRIGGEEFGVLLPGVAEDVAEIVAERLRELIRTGTLTDVPVTASFGVASRVPGLARPFSDLYEAADDALYLAKDGGRDRTVTAGR